MKYVSRFDRSLIEGVFKESYVYSIKELPLNLAYFQDSRQNIRWEYTYGSIGLVNKINDFYRVETRLLELITSGDSPSSLRQRLNIVNTLLLCNLDTDVPVHTSISPEHNLQGEVDLKDIKPGDIYFIAHPGHTRVEGSIFLNIPLKNSLLYINKKHNLTLKQNNNVQRVHTIGKLLESFNSRFTDKDKKYWYSFSRNKPLDPTVRNRLKTHDKTDVRILKLGRILERGSKIKRSSHPSAQYLKETYKSFNNFCNQLFTNNIKIYTQSIGNVRHKFFENSNSILEDKLKLKLNTNQSVYNLINNKVNYIDLPARNEAERFDFDTKYEKLIHSELTNVLSKAPSKDHKMFTNNSFKYIQTKETNIEDLVRLNNYKGFIIFVDSDQINYINRALEELLFCIPYEVSLSRTENNAIKIVNCAHEGWKSSELRKEVVIDNRFLL